MSQNKCVPTVVVCEMAYFNHGFKSFCEAKGIEQTPTGSRTSWLNHAETSSCLFEKRFALTQAHLANDSAFAGVAVGRFSLGSAKHQTQQDVSNPTRRLLRIERQASSQHFQIPFWQPLLFACERLHPLERLQRQKRPRKGVVF